MWRRILGLSPTSSLPMLGRWCHRQSPEYPKCDPLLKTHLANIDNGATLWNRVTPPPQRVPPPVDRDPVSVFSDCYGI